MPINYPSDWTKINPQIPFVGKWKAKVTYIEKMWAQPCGASPTLMVLGAFAALPSIAWAIFQPDCLDHTFDRIGRPHGRRRRPTFKVEDFASPLAAPKSGWGWAMFQGAKLAQRAGFYALLIDAYLDWHIAGTSLAFQWNGCEDPNQGFANLTQTNAVAALFPAAQFMMNTWTVEEAHIFGGGGTGIDTPSGHEAGVGFSLTQIMNQFPPLPDCTFTAKLIDTVTGWSGPTGIQYEGTGEAPQISYQSSNHTFSQFGHAFRIICTKTAGVMVVDGHMSAGGINLTGVKPTACGHSVRGFD